MLPKLNFSEYKFKLKKEDNGLSIFDVCRKKYVACSAEEWVRQHCLKVLTEEKKFPLSLINVEKSITVNGLKKRYDLVVYYPSGLVRIVVECKAPEVKLDQKVFDQISIYNLSLQSDYFWVTNGLTHVFSKPDFNNNKFIFIKDLPSYQNV